ncbi:MAG: TonB-dependent receptor [Candidatus Kapaibacterium sp.]
MRSTLLVVVIVIVNVVLLTARGTVSGVVRDAETHEPLRGVTVRVETTALGGNTNKNGVFVIRAVPDGNYTLLVSMVGYNSAKKEVRVKENDSVFVQIEIKSQAIQTSEVVVSANKRVQAVQDVPMSVSTVDARAVQQRNATRLDDVLRYVPGVNISQYNVNIRGASGFAYGLGSRTMVLLDNFPLLSGDNGDISFDALPVFETERVEVVKGAGSALYGTSALGGVVNVITREPKDYPEFRFRGYSGLYTRPRFDTWEYQERLSQIHGFDASYSQRIGTVGWIMSGGMKGDDSYRQFDDSFRWNLYNKFTFAPTPLSNVLVYSQYAYEDRANWLNWYNLQYATRPPLGTNMEDRVRSHKYAAGAEYKQIISGNTFGIIRSSYYRTSYENNVGFDQPDYLASTAGAINLEGQVTTYLNEKILFTAGVNLLRNDVSAPNLNGDKGQSITSAYAQTEFTNLEDVIVTVGGRFDLEKTFGQESNAQFSPKVGISYKTPGDGSLRLSLGRAFRAASITERFAAIRFSGFTVGRNLDLRSETGWSFELGATQSFEVFSMPFQMDAALFQSELYDLIEPQFVINSTKSEIQFVNITRARIQGIEAGLKGWFADKLVGVETSITAMNPRNLTLDKTLTYRHNLMWTSRILIPINPVEIQFDYRYLSRQEEVDERIVNLGLVVNGDIRVPIHVVDARVLMDFNKFNNIPVTVSINIKNLFDYYYVEVLGNLARTRQVSIQFDAKL